MDFSPSAFSIASHWLIFFTLVGTNVELTVETSVKVDQSSSSLLQVVYKMNIYLLICRLCILQSTVRYQYEQGQYSRYGSLLPVVTVVVYCTVPQEHCSLASLLNLLYRTVGSTYGQLRNTVTYRRHRTVVYINQSTRCTSQVVKPCPYCFVLYEVD